MRIEKGKMERVIKPFKGISLEGHGLSLTQSALKYLVYKMNRAVSLSPGKGLCGNCVKQ